MNHQANFQVYSASAGSGKTYTLVQKYLSILLRSPFKKDRYKNILALTFTNKAAAEMKQRVLARLKQFSNGEDTADFSKEHHLTTEEIKERADKVLHHILENYSDFQIATLDSFTHRIINSFAIDLKLPSQFEVSMNTNTTIEKAVEKIIAVIGNDKDLTKLFIDFAKQKIKDEKSWNFKDDLKKEAQILFKESDRENLQKLKKLKIADFKNTNDALQKKKKTFLERLEKIATNALATIENAGLDHDDFKGKTKGLKKFFQNTIDYNFSSSAFDFQEKKGNLHANMQNDSFYKENILENIKQNLSGAYDAIKKDFLANYRVVILADEFQKKWVAMAVLGRLKEIVDDIKTDENIQFNAEFNGIIYDEIKDEPTPFIYERIGQKYRHYFIDEMQDTSCLQWANLLPLLQETLATEKTSSLMLVGDGKQSIYRWRGGDPQQFIGLADNTITNKVLFQGVKKSVENLPKNWRSAKEIVNFNNEFFNFLADSDFFKDKAHQNLFKNSPQKIQKNDGGYVQIDFLERPENPDETPDVFCEKIMEILDGLTKKNTPLGDVCILVRKNKEGKKIAEYLQKNNINVVSAEALLVKNSPFVQCVVAMLKVLENEEDAVNKFEVVTYFFKDKKDSHPIFKALKDATYFFTAFAQKLSKQFSYQNFEKQPINEAVNYLLGCFFTPDEMADVYLQDFLDWVHKWSEKNSGIDALLKSWAEESEKKSIATPENKDAVKIMTIHKSKGLEFPTVIYTHTSWDGDRGSKGIYSEINPTFWFDIEKFAREKNIKNNKLPVAHLSFSREKTTILDEVYTEKHLADLQLDEMNNLYVALTRAERQLYVLLPDTRFHKAKDLQSGKEARKYISDFFITFLQGKNEFDKTLKKYSFGKKTAIKPCKKKDKKNIGQCTAQKIHYTPWFLKANMEEKTPDKNEWILLGNIFHELMQNIYTVEDLEKINFDDLAAQLSFSVEKTKGVVEKIIAHPDLKKYFNAPQNTYNERDLLDQKGNTLRPDKLVFQGEKVHILDYKTGQQDDKEHQEQLNEYEYILTNLGYDVIEKTLCYIDFEAEKIKIKNV